MTNDVRSFRTADGAVVEYSVRGDGAGVVLIHAGVFADWFLPLMSEPALDGFQVVRLRRAGYVGGTSPTSHVSLADHARHVAEVVEHVGLGASLIVGHSSGALIALELAVARPELVGALMLLEPAPGGGLVPAAVRDGLSELLASASSTEEAYDLFMAAAVALDHREAVRVALGDGGLARAIQESAWFFADEVPAVAEWSFGVAVASDITQPSVLVVGGASSDLYGDVVQRLASWLPNSSVVTIDGADHMFPLRRPDQLAELIATTARASP